MITFRPAKRERTPLAIGIGGPSKCGKTYSALRLATGLAQGGPIFFIDTESGRGLQYADRFKYEYASLDAPFTSERYIEYLEAAANQSAAVVIVDSMSHEHEGPGGMLERHEENLTRMAGNDYAKRERVKFTAWIEPKKAHNKFVNRFLQLNTHFIFCFRAKDKIELRKGTDGKTEPKRIGWTPICSDRFEYETTFMLILPEGARGVPDLDARSSGLRDPFDKIIPAGVALDESLGAKLAEWSAGKKEPKIGGMPETNIIDWCSSMEGSQTVEELGRNFTHAMLACKDLKDGAAQKRITAAKDKRKLDLVK